jgi:hypothetical protein
LQDLFRYVEWRSPKTGAAPHVAITISGTSPFRRELEGLLGEAHPVETLAAAAAAFASSKKYALAPGALKLSVYDEVLLVADEWFPESGETLAGALSDVLGHPVADVAASLDLVADRTAVHDSLIAVKLTASTRGDDATALLSLARVINLIERTGHADPLATTRAGVEMLLDALVVLPPEFLIVKQLPEAPGVPELPAGGVPAAQIAALERRSKRLQEAYDYLSTIGTGNLTIGSAPPSPGSRTEYGFFWSLWMWILRLFGLQQRVTESDVSHQDLTLTESALSELPHAVSETLAELGLDGLHTPIPTLVAAVLGALTEVQQQLRALAPLAPVPVYQLGGHFVTLAGSGVPTPSGFLGTAPQVKIQPVGFGDLQVVKQQIVRYERGEISYIENVMDGEHYDREVQRKEIQEEITVSERERIKEEERDLQATDRFELHTQSEATSRDTVTTTSANTVTAHYGSFVDGRNSNFARDVVNRAVNRLTERVREQRTVRMQRELLEKTVHGFENKPDGEHVSGIYQWVDKVYQAQVFTYGKRLLYEAVIPEPAAFLIAMRRRSGQPEAASLTKPPEPSFGPADLQAWNYLYYAKLYDVVGAVEPPPEPYKSVTKGIREVWDSDKLLFSADSIPIPDGYTALSISYYRWNNWSYPGSSLGLVVGNNAVFANTFALSGETDSLPVYTTGNGQQRFVVNMMVSCQRKPGHLERWQIRTYEALLKGYRRQQGEYEERLANLQALVRTQMLLGASESENRQTERVELKRAFLTMLTNQQFDAFDAINSSSWGYPEPDIKAATDQSGFVSFFERAFEWENMLYFFYPYFWGRKGGWPEVVLIDDPDPQFEAFLRAGAARVVVPVRPGFEGALAHYVETGQVWLGEGEPNMYSPLFVSILQEIKDRDKAPGEEKPVGKPWHVRLPTTLVLLRPDETLPAWKQNPDGQWVPTS